MPGLPSSLKDAGCRKQLCRTGSDTLHRHHKRHQAMWIGVWAGLRKEDPEFHDFVRRYNEFHQEDIVYVCDSHHAEIHMVYDEIIQLHKLQTQKPLYKYTWDEANDLMDRLEERCISWLDEQTEGYSVERLRAKRRKRSD